MAFFDVSLNWVILAPQIPAARTAAAELSRIIALLRTQATLSRDPPAVEDAAGPAPGDSVPVIVLNAAEDSRERSGFTWRCGRGRIEIYGDSSRGLCNGVYDFLAALGVRWPQPRSTSTPVEELPPRPTEGAYKLKLSAAGSYPLRDDRAYVSSDPSPANRRRLLMPEKAKPRELDALIQWAARNRFDALVFSLRDRKRWE
jgi:hypothetical protein